MCKLISLYTFGEMPFTPALYVIAVAIHVLNQV